MKDITIKTSLNFALVGLAFTLLTLPVTAQERELSEMEITQLYQDLLMKEGLIVDTDEIELEDKQREEIAEQISFHYTDDAVIKLKDIALTEKGHRFPIYQIKIDRFAYESLLSNESKLKNLAAEFDIKEINFAGQRADVDLDIIYTYQIDATDYDDIVKVEADVISKSKCSSKIKIDYDGMPRISHETCDMNTFISNIEVDIPDHMKERMGSAEIKFGPDLVFKR